MFSKEESKKMRELFWTSFGKSFPKKWMTYNTGIKGLTLKFHFDTKTAMVAMDIEDDLLNRMVCWDNLISLKSILTSEYLPEVQFEEIYFLPNGKEISRIFVKCQDKVSIHDKSSWQKAMIFLHDHMLQLESFFIKYKDVIRS